MIGIVVGANDWISPALALIVLRNFEWNVGLGNQLLSCQPEPHQFIAEYNLQNQ
jgi:hypothetical protein